MTTVGFGDFSPHTPVGKLFHSFYVFIGLGLVSGVVSWLINYLMEERDKLVATNACRNMDINAEESETGELKAKSIRRGDSYDPIPAVQAPEKFSLSDPYCLSFWHDTMHISPHIDMRKILNGICLQICNVAIGTLFFTLIVEKYSVIDAIYLSSMTVTAIGFGDILPTNFYSRLFIIFYAIFGTLLTARCLSYFSEVLFQYMRLKKEELLFSRMLHISTFLEMSEGANDVSKERFVLYKLILLDLVDVKVIEKAESQFEAFSKSKQGVLNLKDVCALPKMGRRKDTYLAQLARRESGGEFDPHNDMRQRSTSLLPELHDRLAAAEMQPEGDEVVNADDEWEAVAAEREEGGFMGRRNTLSDVMKYMKGISADNVT
jgi:hypothetical protein